MRFGCCLYRAGIEVYWLVWMSVHWCAEQWKPWRTTEMDRASLESLEQVIWTWQNPLIRFQALGFPHHTKAEIVLELRVGDAVGDQHSVNVFALELKTPICKHLLALAFSLFSDWSTLLVTFPRHKDKRGSLRMWLSCACSSADLNDLYLISAMYAETVASVSSSAQQGIQLGYNCCESLSSLSIPSRFHFSELAASQPSAPLHRKCEFRASQRWTQRWTIPTMWSIW